MKTKSCQEMSQKSHAFSLIIRHFVSYVAATIFAFYRVQKSSCGILLLYFYRNMMQFQRKYLFKRFGNCKPKRAKTNSLGNLNQIWNTVRYTEITPSKIPQALGIYAQDSSNI